MTSSTDGQPADAACSVNSVTGEQRDDEQRAR
jgi:hypothetical protein